MHSPGSSLDRRQFMAAAASLSFLSCTQTKGAAFKTTIKKAKIIGKPEEQLLRDMKAAVFDGVVVALLFEEEAEAKKARELVEGIGLKVPSVRGGGAEFNSEAHGKVTESEQHPSEPQSHV